MKSVSLKTPYLFSYFVSAVHLHHLNLLYLFANEASIHMPRIGYQDASDRSEWYAVERILRKHAVMYGIKIYVYASPPLFHAISSFMLNYHARLRLIFEKVDIWLKI